MTSCLEALWLQLGSFFQHLGCISKQYLPIPFLINCLQYYWETFAPVVNWMSVWFLLMVAKIHGLDTKAINFVLSFPQATLNTPIFMEIPAGMELNRILLANQCNWYKMLKKGLIDQCLKVSQVDPCVFIQNNENFLVYVDDCIVISPKSAVIVDFIQSLKDGPKTFEFTKEGYLESYLGVKFTNFDQGRQFEMSQQFLIERILVAMGIKMRMTEECPNPVVKPLLH